jgi:hypothetical protein
MKLILRDPTPLPLREREPGMGQPWAVFLPFGFLLRSHDEIPMMLPGCKRRQKGAGAILGQGRIARHVEWGGKGVGAMQSCGSRAVVALWAIVVAQSVLVGEEVDPAALIYPPHATVHGKTLGEWGAAWWNWAASMPLGKNALRDDPTGALCHEKQSGPVFFLGGAFASGTYVRACTVETGKDFYFPIVNSAAFNSPGEARTREELINASAGSIDRASLLECSIDDQALTMADLLQHREPHCCFALELPPDHVFGSDPPGTYEPVAHDGYYIMVRPLPLGDHTIRFKMFIGDPDPQTALFWLDITYRLRIVEAGSASFRRGETNGDGQTNLSDAVFILDYLFRGGSTPACIDAADVDDNGNVNLTDPVFLLNHLFSSGPTPPPPGTDQCGADPTEDGLPSCSGSC